MAAADRALLRIREEMQDRHITQRDLAERMDCSQGRIAKLLNARTGLLVKDLDRLATAVGITLTEAVRDRGLEFYAEMTPLEVRLLNELRKRPTSVDALVTLLRIHEPKNVKAGKTKPGRPLFSSRKSRESKLA